MKLYTSLRLVGTGTGSSWERTDLGRRGETRGTETKGWGMSENSRDVGLTREISLSVRSKKETSLGMSSVDRVSVIFGFGRGTGCPWTHQAVETEGWHSGNQDGVPET